MSAQLTIGLFVGGAGKRMGGVAKGLLSVRDGSETLIARLQRICVLAAPAASLYLVGQSADYAALGLRTLCDDPPQVGPIGGLRSLLLRARDEGSTTALALACDLPFLDEKVLSLLLEPRHAAARVPVADGRFQPLAAAYTPQATLEAVDRTLALGKHALMSVLDQLGSALERIELDAAQAQALRDWDTPEDVRG